jgi:hypothetical protein
MRKQGKNNVKISRKTARGPMKAMVSPSILKVNLSHLAYFDTHRDRHVAEAAPLATRTVPLV